ncbi:MAG TPA: hypothetical protein VGA18_01720 [Rhodothermales bacterium]
MDGTKGGKETVMDEALAGAVTEAMEKHARRSSAILLVNDGEERSLGTATCVQFGERVLLATAGHVISTVRQQSDLMITAWGEEPCVEGIPFSRISYRDHLGDKDVGWIEIDGAVAASRGLQAIDLRSLSPYERPSGSNLYMAYGVPAQFAKVRRDQNTVDVRITAIGYLTIPVFDVVNDVELVLEYKGQAWFSNPARGFEMPNPKGMSGGGIWSLTNFEAEEPWSPTKCRLVGTIRSYRGHEGTLHGVQIQHWLQLVRDDLPELAAIADELLER